MAHRRGRKGHSRQPLNYPLILSLAVLLSAYILVTFLQGKGWFDVKAELEYWLGDLFSFSQTGSISQNGDVRVHFIDVGQGDCILIENQAEALLIDAGENDQGGVVLDYLKMAGIDHLNLVIGTHPHSDHIGGLDTVLDGISAERMLLPDMPDEQLPTTRTFSDLLTAVEQNHVALDVAEPGSCLSICGGTLEFLGPIQKYEDLNNYSIVCRFVYEDTSFLLTGDMEKDAEQDLLDENINLSADVLKMGHHGSSTSSGAAFIEAVDADIYVMMLGEDNSYGHPHREILQLLEKLGKPYYRTDQNGTVVLASDGRVITVDTEK